MLLVGAAGGFDWDAGQGGGPAEQVGTVWSLLDKLRSSLNKCSNTKHTIIHNHKRAVMYFRVVFKETLI